MKVYEVRLEEFRAALNADFTEAMATWNASTKAA